MFVTGCKFSVYYATLFFYSVVAVVFVDVQKNKNNSGLV